MWQKNQGIKSVCSLCAGNEKWNNAFDNNKFFKVPCAGVTIKQYRVFHEKILREQMVSLPEFRTIAKR